MRRMILDELTPKGRYRCELNDELALLTHRDFIDYNREQVLVVQLDWTLGQLTIHQPIIVVVTILVIIALCFELVVGVLIGTCLIYDKRIDFRFVFDT